MRGKVLRRSKSKHVGSLNLMKKSTEIVANYRHQSFKPSWKPGYLVLRPNLLSLYKDEEEARLQLSISFSEVSAVAHVKSPKSKRSNVFGIFSPSKNFRFQAASAEEAQTWVDRIRKEYLAEYPDSILAFDPPESERVHIVDPDESGFEHSDQDFRRPTQPSLRLGSPTRQQMKRIGIQDSSGNDITSCSDFSDVPGRAGSHLSTGSYHKPRSSFSPSVRAESQYQLQRTTSQHSGEEPELAQVDRERVIFHGYLQCLKHKKGVRKWKKYWVVLRIENLYFYKNDQEYAASKILPMEQVVNAADIDPISRSKPYCFQLITEKSTYRFSAPDEQTLDKWLGSLKSVLMRLQDEANPLLPASDPPGGSL